MIFLFSCFSLAALERFSREKYAEFVKNKAQRRVVWVLLFYTPFCKKHKEYLQAVEQAMVLTNGTVKYGHVNCQADQNLCSSYGINEYPTILIRNYTASRFYTDQINPVTISKQALKMIHPGLVQYVDDFFIDELREKPTAILFKKTPKLPGYWAALSRSIPRNKLRFAFCPDDFRMDDYNVTNVPTIVFYNATSSVIYDSFPKIRYLKEFAKAFIENREPNSPAIADFHFNVEFPEVCYDYSVSCVFSYDEYVDPKADEVRIHFKNDPFQFFVGTDHFPFPNINAKLGQYVIYSGKKKAIITADINSLTTTLERVLDGGAKWNQLQKYEYLPEL